MHVPSGDHYTKFDLKLLQCLGAYGFVKYSERPYVLESEIPSCVYVFGREDLTDHPGLEWLVGQRIAEVVWRNSELKDRQPCLIGIPTAGTALAQAAAMASWLSPDSEKPSRPDICHRIMRERKKLFHGAGEHKGFWVNGRPDLDRHTYWGLDNVATSGRTKIDRARNLIEDGYPAYEMPWLIFIDRQQGALRRLRERGFKRLYVAYNLLDITFAYGELGLWPKEAVRAVEEEIRAHQSKKDID